MEIYKDQKDQSNGFVCDTTPVYRMPKCRNRQSIKEKASLKCSNPRVVLKPLLADSTYRRHFRFTSLPSTAALFNKPDYSDLRLHVGRQTFYVHRLVLCAASEVFRHMLDERWLESKKDELTLEEEEDCAKHFERFLQYLYTGSIVLCETYLLPLFMLADKFVVKPLYAECVRRITDGLKVYLITKKSNDLTLEPDGFSLEQEQQRFSVPCDRSTDESSDNESIDLEIRHPDRQNTLQEVSTGSDSQSSSGFFSNASNQVLIPPGYTTQTTYLVASEIFPVLTVLKMIHFCHDDRIKSAALYNLEARLSKDISRMNLYTWNEISEEILLLILRDNHFYCPEYLIFKAVTSWFNCDSSRQITATLDKVLSHIRYPILSKYQLYSVEKEPLVKESPKATELVHSAIRYHLFKDIADSEQEQWKGALYQERTVKYDE